LEVEVVVDELVLEVAVELVVLERLKVLLLQVIQQVH
jgi:hypothetical protein|tara:strand:- start:584 stop:694 length:111 start_codon:yes stop_codon:yes gene_type:complete